MYLGLLNRIIIDNLELVRQKQQTHGQHIARGGKNRLRAAFVKDGRIYISSAQIFGFNGTFYKADSHSKPNFQFVLDSLSSKNKSKKSNLELSINSLIIRHGAVKFDVYDKATTPARFNAAHLDINDISAHLIIPYYTGLTACL